MRYINTLYPLRILVTPVADSDFDLRRGPDFTLLAQVAFLPSVISSFFTQNKGVGGGGSALDPPLSSARYAVFMSIVGYSTFHSLVLNL